MCTVTSVFTVLEVYSSICLEIFIWILLLYEATVKKHLNINPDK